MKKQPFISRFYVVIAVMLLATVCKGQSLNEIQTSLTKYQQSTPQEKIYAHVDKSFYLTGEIIWFKLYTVSASDHKPMNLSKVAYVDVIDHNQNPVLQAKISLKNGIGAGSIYVPVSMVNGNYKLRAYTNWMKNFSPDYYFEKVITVINPLRSPEAEQASSSKQVYDVQFFPEGGSLVAGLTSKVGFKAVDQRGKGVNFRGAIINQRNDTLVKFQSFKFGMGNFTFTPAANNTYRAVIKPEGAKPYQVNLPAIASTGYVLQLKDNGTGSLELTLTSSAASNNEQFYLVAHTRQVVKVAQSGTSDNNKVRFVVDKNKLGDGISHFAIFNNARQPLAERLYFKRPQQQLVLDASSNQPQYGLRQRVDVAVNTKGSTNADLSMAVYRVDSLQKADYGDILSYLWLNSELKGHIESAEYYFTEGKESEEAADNLMLSQGWSRFKWTDVLNNKPAVFKFLPEYAGHLITGRITNTAGRPANDVIVYLSAPGKRVQLYTSKSDQNGHLLFNTKDFYGSSEIIVQTNTEVDTSYRIEVFSPFSERHSSTRVPELRLSNDDLNLLNSYSLATQVQNVYTGPKLRQYFDLLTDSSAFYGKPYKTYKLDDYTRFTTVEEVMREYVSEVNIAKRSGRFHIKVLNETGFLNGVEPLVMLDAIPIFNIDKVFALDPLKIRKLEVVPYRYFWGPSVSDGIFSYTTYKGDMAGLELDPRAVVVDYEGMQLEREFYAPVYDSEGQQKSRLPDYRNLLFWSPSVHLGSGGKANISFYTSDLPGKYLGIVQGITADGNAGSKYFTFEVK